MFPQPQKLQWSDKNPADVVDYSIDWIHVLKAFNGDTIASASWSVPSGLNLGAQIVLGTTTSAFISGGVADQTYQVTCTITTAGGRTVRRQVLLGVRNF